MLFMSRVMIGIGLVSWTALLVIGAVALARDWLSERANLRKAIDAVQHKLANRRTRMSTTVCRRLEGAEQCDHSRSEPDLHRVLARPPSRRADGTGGTGHSLQLQVNGDS
jgi:hypothetical protein